MSAAIGAKYGARCPHTHRLSPQASATATAACTIERQETRTRSQRVRMETRDRSVASSSSGGSAGMRSVERAAVLHQVEAEQRLGERSPRGRPALALIERARASLAGGRVEPDRLVALARRLLERE